MRVIKLDRSSTPGRVSISGVIDTGSGVEPVSFTPSHPRWAAVEAAVEAYYNASSTNEELAAALRTNFRLGDAVNERFVSLGADGRLRVEGNRVTFDGDPIESVLEAHILRLLNEDGSPRDAKNWKAFAKFVENLYSNVSEYVRDQLFGWLSYESLNGHGFTLTEDGCFIGYKGLTGTKDAPTSISHGTATVNGKRHTGAIPNPVGAIVEMPRSEVQFDPAIGCAPGLHIGTLNYAKGWSRGVLALVKVNPRDVVSVPVECLAQKIRARRYEVLEITEHAQTRTTYYSDSEDDLLNPAHDLAGAASDGTAVNEGDVVSFDYTTLDGRSNHYEVTVRYLNNYHLDGTRSDGSPRTFRVERIKNMVNHSITDADDSSASVDTVDDSGDSQDSSAGSDAQVAPGTVVTIQYRKRYSHPVKTYHVRVTSTDADYVNGDLTDGGGRRSFLRDRIVSLSVDEPDDSGDSQDSSAGSGAQVAPGTVVTIQYRKRYSHPVKTYHVRVTSTDADHVNGDLTGSGGRRSFLRDRIVSLSVDEPGDSGDASQSTSNQLADLIAETARTAGLSLNSPRVDSGDDYPEPTDEDDPGTEEDEEIRRNGYGSGHAWDCN